MRTAQKRAHTGGAEEFRYPTEKLRKLWDRLHRGDREPWPDAKTVARLGAHNEAFADWLDAHGGADAVAQGLEEAWREFHSGNLQKAIKLGSEPGAIGASPANKAAAVATLYAKRGGAQRLQSLETAVRRGEAAARTLPEYANAHYMLALALGRYSQDISIIKAVAAGLATRVRTHLERAVELEPRHAEAHLALGLYHAELIGKLGSIAAGLTCGASAAKAVEHFQRALKLAPASPIVHIEYANGLMVLNAARNRAQAEQLYAEAATFGPIDAMEEADVERAKRGMG